MRPLRGPFRRALRGARAYVCGCAGMPCPQCNPSDLDHPPPTASRHAYPVRQERVAALAIGAGRANSMIRSRCPAVASSLPSPTRHYRIVIQRGLLEPDIRLNVVKKLEFQAAQYAAFGGRRRWISPRFSSLLFSLCSLAGAVCTAVDAGTERG
jgi:hypothetical protein